MRDDEGCQGNPPCQPASAYFSPLSRSIQHPPASSRTKRTPSPSPSHPLATARNPPRHPSAASHGTFLRSFFSLRVPLHVRITVDHHKPTLSRSTPISPLSSSPSVISRSAPPSLFLSLRLSSDVSFRYSLSSTPLLIFPPR